MTDFDFRLLAKELLVELVKRDGLPDDHGTCIEQVLLLTQRFQTALDARVKEVVHTKGARQID